MESKPLQRGPMIVGVALLCTLLWGTAYPAVKIGYELFAIDTSAGQLLFAGLRFTLAGLMTLAVSVALQKRLVIPQRGQWKGITLLGLVQTTGQYIFFYLGLANTTGVNGSILYAMATFFVVIFAHFLFPDDKMSVQKIVGCVIGFAGVLLITMDGSGIGGGFAWNGEGFIILSTLSSALGSIISRRVSQGQDPVVVTGYQLTLGGLVLILMGALGQGAFGVVTGKGVALLVYMAFLSAAAFTGWTMLLKYNPASRIAVYNFLIPVFGAGCSVLFLGESLFNVRSLLALVLACAGIYIVNKEFTGAKKTIVSE